MEAAVTKGEAQLKRWRCKIDNLAAKTQVPGVNPGFDAVTYIDELKVLHAIAQSKFDQFKTAEGKQRARVRSEMKDAWTELDAAFKNRKLPL